MGVMIRGGGGLIDEAPVVTELKTVGEPTQTSISISYKVTDAELQIVRHYLTVSGVYDKKEITKEVGYDIPDGVYIYTITGLTKGTTYTIQIMCSDGLLEGNSNALQASTESIVLYSFTITEADSNPTTRVQYGDEAVGVSIANRTGLGGWENKFPFNKIRLVGLKNGKVVKEIKKSNKRQYTDGTAVPTDGSVDVMTEFPTIYWRKTASSGQIKFEISDSPIPGGDCYAHRVGGVVRPTIYVGCYLGFIFSGTGGDKLSSCSGGLLPSAGSLLSGYREAANKKGTGYGILNFNILTMLQILFVLAYRNTNSQSILGMGYVESTIRAATGGTDTKGWVYGSTSDTEQMCFLGIEDLWGNLKQAVDGLTMDDNLDIHLCTNNANFNDTGSGFGWQNIGKSILNTGDIGYSSKMHTGDRTGFFPIEKLGSDTTYYSDRFQIKQFCFPTVGGEYTDDTTAGIFYFRLDLTTYSGYDRTGTRLVYIGEVN